MSAKAGRHDDQYMVRFPEGMRDRIKAAAETNGRSMNSEIIARLEDSFVERFRLEAGIGAVSDLMAAVLARVAIDMQRDGKSPDDFLAWVRDFPEFARFLPPDTRLKMEPKLREERE